MTDEDILWLPYRYASQVRPALTYQNPEHVRDLIRDLTGIRDEFASVAKHTKKNIDEYDTDEKRAGREKVLEDGLKSVAYCERVASAADAVLSDLTALKL